MSTLPNLTPSSFKKLQFFSECSNQNLQRICNEGSIVRFSIGQTLCSGEFIPDRVLLIISGTARLITTCNGKIKSLALIGQGNLVGLASLLRAEACEEISAATVLEAWSIPDCLLADIYSQEESFRNWCNSNVFPAEVASLLGKIIDERQDSTFEISDIFEKILPEFQAVDATNLLSYTSLEEDLIYIASNNSDLSINTQLQQGNQIPKASGIFDLRLLKVRKNLIEQIHLNYQPEPTPNLESTNKVKNSTFPNRTVLNLKGNNIKDSFTLIQANGVLEESLACFQMLAELMELPLRRDALEKSIRETLRRGVQPSLPMFGQLLTGMGLLATGARVKASFCTRMNVPCLIQWRGSWGLAVQSNTNGLLIAHPRYGWIQANSDEVSAESPDGVDVILVSRTSSTPNEKFNFSWFLPAIKRYRSSLLLVLGSSFIVQLFTLANPLLIQVIIDKVISQRSLDTLQVLGIALVAVTIFEGLLSSLRTFLFTDTTNRIDMRLGSEVIDHLLRLPIGYFEARPVGEMGTRIAELEKIRNFLTGEALSTIIDAAFSVIYIIVMALYSWVLTLVALFVVPIQVVITLAGAPIFRRQFRNSAEENAKTQSHLMEILTGIQTVKAQNVEVVSRWKWQELYSSYIARTFEKTITGTALSQTGQVLQKISQLMVLWVGARLVLNGELSLGQLIAFRIISGYVTQPLLRLSTIWQRIQELRVSFERLADIIDTPEESNKADQGKIPLPPIKGEVIFKDIDFRFKPRSPKVLKNINISIESGVFVGVVGQSGSGKSTLMKLIPRLYSPDSGRVLIDGFDVDKVELYSLRRQIGIVPQEPLLFTGTVSENIALTDRNATSEDIAKAAQIACAHDFVMSLPSGYSTELGERGSNLSGGQRQRLAIARTLLANPKLLVMDEATSALDYDTENRVCQNLRESLKDCTVFFVTHRLSTVRKADMIVMMHQGAIVETGTHDELMALQGRYYALFRQQDAN